MFGQRITSLKMKHFPREGRFPQGPTDSLLRLFVRLFIDSWLRPSPQRREGCPQDPAKAAEKFQQTSQGWPQMGTGASETDREFNLTVHQAGQDLYGCQLLTALKGCTKDLGLHCRDLRKELPLDASEMLKDVSATDSILLDIPHPQRARSIRQRPSQTPPHAGKKFEHPASQDVVTKLFLASRNEFPRQMRLYSNL